MKIGILNDYGGLMGIKVITNYVHIQLYVHIIISFTCILSVHTAKTVIDILVYIIALVDIYPFRQ